MTIADIMFDEFFSQPIPREGFVIDPAPSPFFGLIEPGKHESPELHGYEVTMEGTVVAPELRPQQERGN